MLYHINQTCTSYVTFSSGLSWSITRVTSIIFSAYTQAFATSATFPGNHVKVLHDHNFILSLYGKRMRYFFWAFPLLLYFSFYTLEGVFNKTVIPLALVGYEMIRADEACCTSWHS